MKKIKKNQEMRLARPKRISQLLMLLLVSAICLGIACTPCTGKQGSSDIKEIMYVGIIPDPGEKMELVKNVELHFYDLTTGPPVNTTLPAFANGLLGTKCELVREARKCSISFEINYSSAIGETQAYAYADTVAQEFLGVFGYTNLNNISKAKEVIGTTIRIYSLFGRLDYTTQTVSMFLKYKPVNGCFAKLISDELLRKYVITEGPDIMESTYTLMKNAQSGFLWDFKIIVSSVKTWPSDAKEYRDVIDVKELLNITTPIVETPSQQSAIIIVIKNVTMWHGKTYAIDIKEIHPEGYVIQDSEFWTNSIDIKYEPLSSPIENITIDISIDPSNSDQSPFIAVGIATAVIAMIIAFFFICRKKTKRR
jgi:hypothetical protein